MRKMLVTSILFVAACTKEEPLQEINKIVAECQKSGRAICESRLIGDGEAKEAFIVINGLLKEYDTFKNGVNQKFGLGAFDSLMKKTFLRIKPITPDYKSAKIEKIESGRYRYTGDRGDRFDLINIKGQWLLDLEGSNVAKWSTGGVNPEIRKMAWFQYLLQDLVNVHLPKSDSLSDLSVVMDEAGISFFYQNLSVEQKEEVKDLVARVESRGDSVGHLKERYTQRYCEESKLTCIEQQ